MVVAQLAGYYDESGKIVAIDRGIPSLGLDEAS
jgi:hypothetical protein